MVALPHNRQGRHAGIVQASVAIAVFALTLPACVRESVPDPKIAANAYAQAATRGDAEALYAMLDDESRRSMSLDDVRRMVNDQRKELADQANAIRSPNAQIKSHARLRFADGEDAVLEVQDGRFYVASADALPSGARTPPQALDQLRKVLARRSYAGLMRVLSDSTRNAVENDLRALVKGLENPEGLDIQQTGDTAVVHLPNGHTIRLRKESGTWRVDDID